MIRPIYTEVAQCQDCYKCLRNCSVKAIEIEEGHARVMSDLCVICGNCVKVCPVGAKKVRDDIKRARVLLQMKERVVV
ncbi:MAG: 4Fe-4S binding protein, partial [Phycisphaerae bacterium]|nr:4Fe-4S binding protein [Phycisphaerae bacterium]